LHARKSAEHVSTGVGRFLVSPSIPTATGLWLENNSTRNFGTMPPQRLDADADGSEIEKNKMH
jgi:hypothetical protein